MPSTSPALPEIVLQLSGPQLWWAYLAVLSAMGSPASQDCRRIVYIDKPDELYRSSFVNDEDTWHVLLFWDGVPPCNELPEDIAAVCKRLRVTVLCVGTNQCAALADARPMYPDGTLRFSAKQDNLSRETAARVRRAKLRNLLIPMKNLLYPGGTHAEAFQLLFGSPRVVFCGSFGLDRKVLGMLDNRYGQSPAAIRERSWVNQQSHESTAAYRLAFQQDMECLVSQYRQGALAELYFVAAARLLDRDYLLHHLRSEQVPLYTNQFSRHFIDVYSTPFYRQHVFLDFGSTISDANYPRTADLGYYGKRALHVDLPSSAGAIAAGIADGSHLAQLEAARMKMAAEVREYLGRGRA